MNQDSSRSHSIFTVTVETSSIEPTENGKTHIRVGKLNLVNAYTSMGWVYQL